MRTWISQMRKGVVELCIMAILHEGEAYGYQLIQKLADVKGLAITESTIYPILSRLTKEGYIQVRVASSYTGPPRRYYRLASSGISRLEQMEKYWKDIKLSIDELLKGENK